MSDDKNNIFIQLYKPIQLVQQKQNNTQSQTQNIKMHNSQPEHFPDLTNTTNEYAPIQEYIEPQIDPALQPHIQNANPPFTPQPNIPLTPTNTRPIPNIPPVTTPNIPLAEVEIEQNLKTNVFNAIRWLAEWCLRQLQINRQRVNNENSENNTFHL